MAFNGTRYLVAWSDFSAQAIVGAVVDTAGTVGLPGVIATISPTGFGTSSPNVASDGATFLVTWQRGSSDFVPSSIEGQRLNGGLAPIGGVLLIYASATGVDGMAPKAAYDGTANYLVTFADAGPTGFLDVLARRVRAADGALLDAAAITVSNASDSQQAPSVAFDGTAFVVAWRDSRNFPGTLVGEIYAATVSPAGVVSPEKPIATGGDKQFPTVHFDGTHTLIAWTDTGPDNLMVALYATGLTPVGAPLVVSPDGSLTGVSLATGSGRTLIAYSQFELGETLGNSFRVRGRFAVNDTTPPVLTVPASITVNATSAAGAVVSYTASATDNIDGAVPISCTPPSGSLFPIGTTTVSCTATDSAGNPATRSFPVTVTGATAQLTSLIAVVNSLGLAQGLTNSLLVKLQAALNAVNAGQTATARTKLNDFISAVNAQSGKGIPSARASQVVAGAMSIKGAIGCP